MKSKDMGKHEQAWHNPYIQLLHNKIKHHNNAGITELWNHQDTKAFSLELY